MRLVSKPHLPFVAELKDALSSTSGAILQVRSKYGVPKDLLGLLEGRQTYVIAKDGTVKLVFNSQFSPEKHPQEALAALNAN